GRRACQAGDRARPHRPAAAGAPPRGVGRGQDAPLRRVVRLGRPPLRARPRHRARALPSHAVGRGPRHGGRHRRPDAPDDRPPRAPRAVRRRDHPPPARARLRAAGPHRGAGGGVPRAPAVRRRVRARRGAARHPRRRLRRGVPGQHPASARRGPPGDLPSRRAPARVVGVGPVPRAAALAPGRV
ncbi:MAG: hypothetical protein AVDCRST_MAG32-2901, partial [uncultured Nocardioides sp.]